MSMNVHIAPKAATVLAAASWTFNFLCQMYGMMADPNMKDIADKYHSFLSPQPFAIAVFFFPQTCLQLYWIYRLYQNSTATSPLSDGLDENEGLTSGTSEGSEELDEAVRYAPIFALGNLSIGLWMVSWNSEHLGVSLLFVLINSTSQLWYCLTQLPSLNKSTALTHVVAKMFAGIGVLDIADNGASAFLNYDFNNFHPGIISYVLTLLGSVGITSMFDPILGACMVYNFLGLFAGQLHEGWWALILLICAGLSAVVVVCKAAKERELYRSIFLDQSNVL